MDLRMVMECWTRRQPHGKLSGTRTGRPSSPLVELQVKEWVGLASWLSIVGSARQRSASRQMRPLANETEAVPTKSQTFATGAYQRLHEARPRRVVWLWEYSSPSLAKGGVQNYSLAKGVVQNCSSPSPRVKGVIHIIYKQVNKTQNQV